MGLQHGQPPAYGLATRAATSVWACNTGSHQRMGLQHGQPPAYGLATHGPTRKPLDLHGVRMAGHGAHGRAWPCNTH
eukprot:360367-Chlamydomonas_euryale.AAC.5